MQAARCACNYTPILARGPAARPRCIPPAMARFRAFSPSRAIRPYRRSITRGKPSALPAPHRSLREDQEAIAPLGTHSHRLAVASPLGQELPSSPKTPMTTSWRPPCADWMRAMSWRRFHRDRDRELSRCPSLDPSHRPWGASHPLEPRPTIRLLDVRQLIEAGPVIALMKARAQSL